MKEIELTKGLVTLIDDEDCEIASTVKWCASVTQSGLVYARGRIGKRLVNLHRYLMGEPKGLQIDHIDGNTLNNQKSNLRVASSSENAWNSRLRKNNSLGFKGVYFCKRSNKFVAQIKFKYKKTHLGTFTDIKDAARAYNEAAKKFFGEFAKLNAIEN